MPAAKDLNPGASPAAFFGAELRRLRTRAGWTQEQLGEMINYSGALVGAVETADRRPQLDFAQRCDEVLGGDGLLARLWPLVRREAYPSWFRPFVDLEREAAVLRGFETLFVHGLLQTADYTRALLRAARLDEEQVEETVAVRLERQEAVLSRDDPPMVYAVLDETVLHRSVGGAKVMAEQLEHLVGVTKNPRMVLQVIPSATGAHAGSGPFTIASFRGAPDAAYLDTVIEGHVSDSPEVVEQVTRIWELVRADALPERASTEVIEKVAKQWI